MMKKCKICFVLPYAYSLFNQATKYIFGGSEVRGYLFGTGLAKFSDYDISFVVFDHGQPKVEQFGTIKVYAHYYYKSSEKPISFLGKLGEKLSSYIEHLKPLNLKIDHYYISERKVEIYKHVDADIYCTFGVGNFTAELALFCKRYGKRFVLFGGSDEDFSERYYESSKEVNSYGSVGALCYFSIMQADIIITQTNRQSRLLGDCFGKSSITIFSPIALSNENNLVVDKNEQKKHALWIGKSDKVKQPDLLLQLARSFPEIDFVMVLNNSNPSIHRFVLDNKLSNMKVIEYLPFGEMDVYFKNSFLLINTSVYEGFPNTFLQAGKYGVPILSLNVDPDDFITKNQCGIVVEGDLDKLKQGFLRLANDYSFRKQCSENIREYLRENHNLETKISELHQALQQIIKEID